MAFIPLPRRCPSALPYFSFLLLAVHSSLPFLFARPCPTEMRFLPSNPARVAAEVLLTVAIVPFVAYDLSGRSSVKPEASNVELSFEAKRPSAAPLAPSSRFEAAAVNGISASNTFGVCGNTVVAANPWVVGGSTNQALEIHLGSGCICNPAISVSNSTTNASGLAGISVQSGSFLSFTDVSSQQSGCGATSGLLQLASGSTLLTGLSSITPPTSPLQFFFLLPQEKQFTPIDQFPSAKENGWGTSFSRPSLPPQVRFSTQMQTSFTRCCWPLAPAPPSLA